MLPDKGKRKSRSEVQSMGSSQEQQETGPKTRVETSYNIPLRGASRKQGTCKADLKSIQQAEIGLKTGPPST